MIINAAQIRREILAQVRQRGLHKTICPSEVARSLSPHHWRDLMPQVRDVGISLAEAALIHVTQRGQIVDPKTAKGPIRYRVTQKGLKAL